MNRTNQKVIKNLVKLGLAEDVTMATVEEVTGYKLRPIAVSAGKYGANGALLESPEGKRFAITARSMALLAVL